MFYLLGGTLVIGGFIGLGMSYLEREKKRIRLIKQWEMITSLYISEINYKKQPLSFAGIEIGKRMGEPWKEIFERIAVSVGQGREGSFSDIWKQIWEEESRNKILTGEEKELVLEMGNCTGYEDEKMQITMLTLQQEQWMKLRRKAEEENKEKRRLILTLCSCMGIMTVLILL